MPTLYTQSERNVRRTWIYISGFLIFVIFLGWIISYFANNYVILIIAVVYSILMSVFSYWHSDKIVLAINGAKLVKREDNRELYSIVENLCITAGLSLPKIYIMKEKQPNAFATGRNSEHSAIVVTEGLLELLNRSELEGVIAHELSHIGNRDILIQSMVVVLVGVVVILTDIFFRITFWGGVGRRDNKSQSRGFVLLIALALAILAPLFAQLIKLAISRKREFLADSEAALLTRYPEGLASALEKISQDSSPLKKANNSTAHLYLASPFKGKQKNNWMTKLFMTHPPIEKRIKALRGVKS